MCCYTVRCSIIIKFICTNAPFAYIFFRIKQTNVTNRVPKALAGGKKGIQIQSAGGIEGSSELCVNLFLSVEDLVSILILVYPILCFHLSTVHTVVITLLSICTSFYYKFMNFYVLKQFCEIPASKSIQLLVHYLPTQKKPKTLYLDSTFLIFNGSNAVTLLEENAPKEIVLKGEWDVPADLSINKFQISWAA